MAVLKGNMIGYRLQCVQAAQMMRMPVCIELTKTFFLRLSKLKLRSKLYLHVAFSA